MWYLVAGMITALFFFHADDTPTCPEKIILACMQGLIWPLSITLFVGGSLYKAFKE